MPSIIEIWDYFAPMLTYQIWIFSISIILSEFKLKYEISVLAFFKKNRLSSEIFAVDNTYNSSGCWVKSSWLKGAAETKQKT